MCNYKIEMTDSDDFDQDVMVPFNDDIGAHRSYITWWDNTYLGVVFTLDYPRGNPKPWRQSAREDHETSKDPSDGDKSDHEDKREEEGELKDIDDD